MQSFQTNMHGFLAWLWTASLHGSAVVVLVLVVQVVLPVDLPSIFSVLNAATPAWRYMMAEQPTALAEHAVKTETTGSARADRAQANVSDTGEIHGGQDYPIRSQEAELDKARMASPVQSSPVQSVWSQGAKWRPYHNQTQLSNCGLGHGGYSTK